MAVVDETVVVGGTVEVGIVAVFDVIVAAAVVVELGVALATAGWSFLSSPKIAPIAMSATRTATTAPRMSCHFGRFFFVGSIGSVMRVSNQTDCS